MAKDYGKFIEDQIAEIKKTAGCEKAINALSGGVDSSVVAALLIRAVGDDQEPPQRRGTT